VETLLGWVEHSEISVTKLVHLPVPVLIHQVFELILHLFSRQVSSFQDDSHGVGGWLLELFIWDLKAAETLTTAAKTCPEGG
jgi:hypothetical protein